MKLELENYEDVSVGCITVQVIVSMTKHVNQALFLATITNVHFFLLLTFEEECIYTLDLYVICVLKVNKVLYDNIFPPSKNLFWLFQRNFRVVF